MNETPMIKKGQRFRLKKKPVVGGSWCASYQDKADKKTVFTCCLDADLGDLVVADREIGSGLNTVRAENIELIKQFILI
jgi:hypothetical protein